MSSTILVVEDEPAIRELISFACQTENYQVIRCGSVAEGRQVLSTQTVDLILLDWMLPDLSGLKWLEILKSDGTTRHIPVIMLTARGSETDKVSGLDAGADDYVVKPFSPRELLARIRAVLRRGTPPESKWVVCGPLRMNTELYVAQADGVPIKLGAIEFKLLLALANSPDRVLSRLQLLERVWEDAYELDERTVDVHILRLRKCLSNTPVANMIETVRGIGYRALTTAGNISK